MALKLFYLLKRSIVTKNPCDSIKSLNLKHKNLLLTTTTASTYGMTYFEYFILTFLGVLPK